MFRQLQLSIFEGGLARNAFLREREVADHVASMKFTTPQHLQDSAMPCATCGVKGEVMQACNASPVGSDLVCILKRTQFDGAGYVKVGSYVDVTGPLHFQNRTFKPMLWSSITGFVATTRPRCKEMEGGCIWIMTSLSRKKLVCRQRLLCLVISYVYRDDNQEVLHS